jgi:aromatic ring-opening dioxygenase catalytic subunit (LigB family)
VLNSEDELFSVVKPESNYNTLSEPITETVKQLSKDDVLVISSGTNDHELDNIKLIFRNIK